MHAACACVGLAIVLLTTAKVVGRIDRQSKQLEPVWAGRGERAGTAAERSTFSSACRSAGDRCTASRTLARPGASSAS